MWKQTAVVVVKLHFSFYVEGVANHKNTMQDGLSVRYPLNVRHKKATNFWYARYVYNFYCVLLQFLRISVKLSKKW